jgi:hypothetical protein
MVFGEGQFECRENIIIRATWSSKLPLMMPRLTAVPWRPASVRALQERADTNELFRTHAPPRSSQMREFSQKRPILGWDLTNHVTIRPFPRSSSQLQLRVRLSVQKAQSLLSCPRIRAWCAIRARVHQDSPDLNVARLDARLTT